MQSDSRAQLGDNEPISGTQDVQSASTGSQDGQDGDDADDSDDEASDDNLQDYELFKKVYMQQEDTIENTMRRTRRAKESFIKEITILIKSTGEEEAGPDIRVGRNGGQITDLRSGIAAVLEEQRKRSKFAYAHRPELHKRNLSFSIGQPKNANSYNVTTAKEITPRRETRNIEKQMHTPRLLIKKDENLELRGEHIMKPEEEKEAALGQGVTSYVSEQFSRN